MVTYFEVICFGPGRNHRVWTTFMVCSDLVSSFVLKRIIVFDNCLLPVGAALFYAALEIKLGIMIFDICWRLFEFWLKTWVCVLPLDELRLLFTLFCTNNGHISPYPLEIRETIISTHQPG
jgi:hypothetical protein